jgi:hypothetical protein
MGTEGVRKFLKINKGKRLAIFINREEVQSLAGLLMGN